VTLFNIKRGFKMTNLIYDNNQSNLVRGDETNDVIYGLAGDDTLFGGAGNDSLFGGQGNDFLQGNTGNDTLYGGMGDDILVGGQGNDVLQGDFGINRMAGGQGADIFVSSITQKGVDIVTDFERGTDKIDLLGASFKGVAVAYHNSNEFQYIQNGASLIAGYTGSVTEISIGADKGIIVLGTVIESDFI
jgi:Ca2+-binding RTX toxin-like protein